MLSRKTFDASMRKIFNATYLIRIAPLLWLQNCGKLVHAVSHTEWPPPKTKSKKKKSKLEGEREGRHTIYVNRQEDERVMTGFATKDNSKEFTLEGNGAYILAEEIPSLTSGYKLALFQSLHCHYPCWGPNLQETKWITIPMKASTSNNWTIGCIMPKLPTTRNRTTPSFPRYINSSIRFSVFQLI